MDVVTRLYPWAVAISMAVLLTLAFHLHILHFIECLFMVFSLEINATYIPRLQKRGRERSKRNSSYIACCIGYKETENIFTECVRSYKAHAEDCKAYLIALDGTVEENHEMVKVFKREFGAAGVEVISYERPLSEMCESFLKSFHSNEKQSTAAANNYAFHCVYDYVKERVNPHVQQILARTPEKNLPAIMISQPHVGMKAVRFAGFMTSMVLADLLEVEFMWSSDSDSRITAGCIESIVAALMGDDDAGSGSAALAVVNRDSNLFNNVYGGQYQNEDQLRWSAGGCVGKCGNCQGPATCYRVGAIKGVIIEWYMQRIAGQRVWINEDIHMNTLIIREGWSSLYVTNTLVESEAPHSVRAWCKQIIRWDRSPHQERLASPWLTFDPRHGFVKLFSHLRELMLMPFLFIFIIGFAFTGRTFPTVYPSLGPGLIISFFVQRFWSVARSSQRRGNYLGCVLAAILYFFAYPFTHVWSLFTFFEDNHPASTTKSRTMRVEYSAFAIWVGVCVVAAVRTLT